MELVSSFQTVFFKQEKNFQKTSCARIASPLLRGRHIVPLDKTAFNKTLEGMDYRIMP